MDAGAITLRLGGSDLRASQILQVRFKKCLGAVFRRIFQKWVT